jgi:hypothetical protein
MITGTTDSGTGQNSLQQSGWLNRIRPRLPYRPHLNPFAHCHVDALWPGCQGTLPIHGPAAGSRHAALPRGTGLQSCSYTGARELKRRYSSSRRIPPRHRPEQEDETVQVSSRMVEAYGGSLAYPHRYLQSDRLLKATGQLTSVRGGSSSYSDRTHSFAACRARSTRVFLPASYAMRAPRLWMFPSGARKVSQVQVPSDSRSPSSSAPRRPARPRLIQVVHFEQRDDAVAVASVEFEVPLAGAE